MATPPALAALAGATATPALREQLEGFRGAGHVGPFADGAYAVFEQTPGVATGELILGGARQRHVTGDVPHRCAGDESGPTAAAAGVLRERASLGQLELLEQRYVDAVRVMNASGRVRAGDDMAAELLHLLDCVDGDVARTRDHHGTAAEGVAARGEHLLHEVGAPITGSLGADLGAAPAEPLAGQHAGLVAIGDPLVLPEQVADLACADPDVAGGNVGLLTEMAVQLGHERLAEAHHLTIRAASRIEVGATLTTADRHSGERVLEHLIEAQELHDREVDRGVESADRPYKGRGRC